MTVENQTAKVIGLGNDVGTVFSFSPIVIFQSSDLEVRHVSADGVETVLTEGTGPNNYSVDVTEFPGTGDVIYPADQVTPLPTGEELVIKRILTIEQTLDLENQGGYFPDLQETAFDKLTMMILDLQEQADRAVKVKISSSTDPDQLVADLEQAAIDAEAAATDAQTAQAAAEAALDEFDDRYLGSKASDPSLDNDGNALQVGAIYWNSTDNKLRAYNGSVWLDVEVTSVSAFMRTVLDDADAASARTTLGAQADLEVPSQAEAEAGTSTTERVWTAERVGQLARAFARGMGQCRLDRVSDTSIRLDPHKGNLLFINGTAEIVPSAGVSLSNSGLSADTNYFIYAYMNSGVMTLEASTTTHATDSTYGHKIKNGDATRTLVGRVRTSSSADFSASQSFETANNVWSYFNRRKFIRSDWQLWESELQTGRGNFTETGATQTFTQLTDARTRGFWNSVPFQMMARIEHVNFRAIMAGSNIGNAVRLRHADNGPSNETVISGSTLAVNGGGSPENLSVNLTNEFQALQTNQSVHKNIEVEYARINSTTFLLWALWLEILWEISDDGNF